MTTIPVLGLLAFAAVLNGTLLGVALFWRGRRSAARWLGLILLGASYLLAVYTLERYDRIGIDGWVRVSYDIVALLLSCFLLEYVHGSLSSRRPHLLIYAPLFIYGVLLVAVRSNFPSLFTIDLLVLVQSVYTAAAIALLLRTPGFPKRIAIGQREWQRAALLTSLFLTIHLAHLIRILLHGNARFDAAPALGITALIAVAGYVLSNTRILAQSSPRPRQGPTEARDLVVALQRSVEKHRLFTDPGLDLPRLAESVGSSAQNVSDALNRQLGRSFYEFVTAYRVEEAKRLLADPTQAHLSLEAIGADSGFRSRSSFYASFKETTGQTPGDFRRAAAS